MCASCMDRYIASYVKRLTEVDMECMLVTFTPMLSDDGYCCADVLLSDVVCTYVYVQDI